MCKKWLGSLKNNISKSGIFKLWLNISYAFIQFKKWLGLLSSGMTTTSTFNFTLITCISNLKHRYCCVLQFCRVLVVLLYVGKRFCEQASMGVSLLVENIKFMMCWSHFRTYLVPFCWIFPHASWIHVNLGIIVI